MITIEQARAASRLRKAESARRVLTIATNQAARAAAAASLPGAPISLCDAARVGRLAIEAERAHTAVLIARAEYFKAHPAA